MLIPKVVKLRTGEIFRIDYIDNRTKSVGITITSTKGARHSVEITKGYYTVIQNIKL